jgi:hypothetical protein
VRGRRLGAVLGRSRPLPAVQCVGRCRVPCRCRGASLASSCSLLDKPHRAAVVRLGKNQGSGWLRLAVVARISSLVSATVWNSSTCPFTCHGEAEDPGHSWDGDLPLPRCFQIASIDATVPLRSLRAALHRLLRLPPAVALLGVDHFDSRARTTRQALPCVSSASVLKSPD